MASQKLHESLEWPGFANDIVSKLIKLANGMFILVSFQLQELLRPRIIDQMGKVLNGIFGRLSDFYTLKLNRIIGRESGMFHKNHILALFCH